MKIINLIDRFDTINFGVWNAAISTANILKEKYNVDSEMWYPQNDYPKDVVIKQKKIDTDIKNIDRYLKEENISSDNTIFISHGCWQYPTRWGNELKKRGYKWIYVPHAMLMPWCINQKKIVKKLYYTFIEKPRSNNADAVRAVGYAELEQLSEIYKNVVQIPNGIELQEYSKKRWTNDTLTFLYLARIHKVKGVDHLIEGWAASTLKNKQRFKLILAGPDDGELDAIQAIIAKQNINNVEYIGPVYGNDKLKLLRESHIFIMPSLTEGFSSSIVEAMQQGCIPLISEGCNMNHLFTEELAYIANPSKESITNTLNEVASLPIQVLETKSDDVNTYVSNKYTLEIIADKQYTLYSQILNGTGTASKV